MKLILILCNLTRAYVNYIKRKWSMLVSNCVLLIDHVQGSVSIRDENNTQSDISIRGINHAQNDISIHEVRTQEELRSVIIAVSSWIGAACKKMSLFGKAKETNKLHIARDAKDICEEILHHRRDYTQESINDGNNVIFVAYENDEEIQGVVFVNLQYSVSCLHLLGVNPDRTKALDSDWCRA